MVKEYKQGFTLAEALVTLVIISLVMAATMPIVLKSQNSPSEAPWKYITQGDLSQNAAVFSVLGETSSAVFGDNRIPVDNNITADKDTIFATKLNPKISVVTRNKVSGPVVGRHLLDFYEKETNGNYVGIGKVSFDRYFNLALGQNSLDAIKSDSATQQKIMFNAANEVQWNEISRLASGAIDTSNTLGAANTAVGQYSMAGNLRYTKIDSAANAEPNIIGVGNTALGAFSMRRITQGNLNTGIGLYALQEAQGSSYNTSLGAYTLKVNNVGNQNTAIGTFAMERNSTGTDNTAVGTMTLQHSTTGNFNTALGSAALIGNTEGSQNVGVGYNSLGGNTTGKYNVGVGYNSLRGNVSGSYNIGIGSNALQGNATGSGNIVIGHNVGITNQSNKLYIGGYVNGDTISYNGTDVLIYGDMASRNLNLNTVNTTIGAEDDTANTFINGHAYIKRGGTNYPIATVTDIQNMLNSASAGGQPLSWNSSLVNTAISDARLKNILGDNKAGLKEVCQLQVKNYTMKNDKKKEVLVGVIAQELQKVFPNSVIEGRDGFLRIKRDEIFYACVNAIKELNTMFKDIVAKVTGLEEKIRILEDKNKINEEKIAALEKQNKLFEERLEALEGKKPAASKKPKQAEEKK